MCHSTGANNPWLKRYVGPDDGLLGRNIYNNHWNTPKPGGRQVCVHAFIGKLADGSIATYQTLPWNHRGWHCGSGSKGSGNDTHISFEICEDDLTDAEYFAAVYREAAELCAYLCRLYSLSANDIICHAEGYKLGIANNHADVLHWWPKCGKSMDDFRAEVGILLGNSSNPDKSDNTISTYTVVKGDSLWSIAKMLLGSGVRYTEIKSAAEPHCQANIRIKLYLLNVSFGFQFYIWREKVPVTLGVST